MTARAHPHTASIDRHSDGANRPPELSFPEPSLPDSSFQQLQCENVRLRRIISDLLIRNETLRWELQLINLPPQRWIAREATVEQ